MLIKEMHPNHLKNSILASGPETLPKISASQTMCLILVVFWARAVTGSIFSLGTELPKWVVVWYQMNEAG